jgi:hypothetical protein
VGLIGERCKWLYVYEIIYDEIGGGTVNTLKI